MRDVHGKFAKVIRMSNVYDVLHRTPRLSRKLPAAQERLARAIVASGKLRLDADNESNFVRLLIPQDRLNLTFTWRELEGELLAASRRRLVSELTERHGPDEAARRAGTYLEKLQTDIKKRARPTPNTELMIARALVLCNAQPAIELLHLEGAELFVSYGHSVSDVMDVATWQDVGEAGGLQAFGQGQNAVYVSCGGHPLLTNEERTYSTDGFPALARLLVIAAQETGHNADMIRNNEGHKIGRYSAQDWGRAPTPAAGKGRRRDIERTQSAHRTAQRMGLNLIAEWERHLEFYRANKLRNLRALAAWLKSRIGWLILKWLLRFQGLSGITRLKRSPSPATLLRQCLHDMHFNLAPQADAYRRPNPTEEEAMMCMEALARVPQQVVKWGHPATHHCMRSLYALYYGKVIPGCARAIAHHKPRRT